MTAEEFEKKVRGFVRKEPYVPFVFELLDGATVLIEKPDLLAFGHGGATYLGSEEIRLIDCEYVRDIRLAMQPVESPVPQLS